MSSNERSIPRLLLLAAALLPLGCVREKKAEPTGEAVATENRTIKAEEPRETAPHKEGAAPESPAKPTLPEPESSAPQTNPLVIEVRVSKDRESAPEVTFKGVAHDDASLAKALAGEVALQRTRSGNAREDKETPSGDLLSPIEVEIRFYRNTPKASLSRVFSILQEVGIYKITIARHPD
jgi:hypothetical protein